MRVLGFESSCDETAVAVVEDGHRVLASVVQSQDELHETYGGVVPEIAGRAHAERIGSNHRPGLGRSWHVLRGD